jgi:alpha-D-ribose 1-methylphosphonate 5-triphosphate synthase subunit PhnG
VGNQTSRQAFDQPRATWPRLLGALDPAQVIDCANQLRAPYRVEPLMLAAQGLALLRMREGCFGEDYHLGEIPLSEAAVELTDTTGVRFKGGARVMAASTEYAQGVAVLDALLAHRLPGWRHAAELLERGLHAVNETEACRGEIRERTRVDFSLLSPQGAGDDDA